MRRMHSKGMDMDRSGSLVSRAGQTPAIDGYQPKIYCTASRLHCANQSRRLNRNMDKFIHIL